MTLRYSLLLSVWVDPSDEHSFEVKQYLVKAKCQPALSCNHQATPGHVRGAELRFFSGIGRASRSNHSGRPLGHRAGGRGRADHTEGLVEVAPALATARFLRRIDARIA